MSALDPLALFIARGFGSGLIKPAPGTWGSIAALCLGYAIVYFAGANILASAALLASTIGIWASARHAVVTGLKDAGEVVIDEFAGQWIALLPVAWLAPHDVLAWLTAFGLFRLFDIWKPGPIGWLDESVHGGLGVMMDDVLAGILAAAILWIGLIYV